MKQIYHVVEAKQLADKELLKELFDLAEKFQEGSKEDSLQGKILATLFYEPSTRTRFSFESAMLRLGGQVITAADAAGSSSAKKGESLQDTIRIVNGYADGIVLRHPNNGAAFEAAEVSRVPLINAGDGSGEHPTQALLDVYTLQKEKGKVQGLCIALVGDLLYGRTVHSLIQLLALYRDIHIVLVSPAALRLPQEYKHYLEARNVSFEETENFHNALGKADAVYMTRLQKERFNSGVEYEQLKHSYILGEKELQLLKKNALIMHPLPRLDEIAPIVDSDPRAAYFRQARNGLFVRMALLQTLLIKQ